MTDDKPLTSFAPPPLSAALTVAGMVGSSLYFFPKIEHPDATIFTNVVFPEILSVKELIAIRLFFAFVCFVGFATAWLTPPVVVTTPYRPKSRAPRITFELAGWKKHFPFTSWSWNLLGISFALNAYIAYQVDQQQDVPDWMVRMGLMLWEVAAPMTLLIGAVVKYALWPAQIKKSGRGEGFMTPRALLQHNANVIMAMAEVALLGGIPSHFSHAGLSVLYGCSYVLFAWSIQTTLHGQGPAFQYFFMDTTIGTEHTIALYVLLSVLMLFYGLFCTVDTLLHMVGNNFTAHATFALTICSLVCRFRD
ncbi:expressed unknown protein [Seminavis robusta]|uniref:Uncharacterized protein n=1 Tax=Seminavis robusta TaxID=568900 RepID=A0A9N8DJM4_9STRA|nr:expressed unknown protein [Seminavis robusta]|eukprot:Sro179_g078550.1 n/a (307) ;mRNA; f:62980-64019